MNTVLKYILQDWDVNRETSFKSRLALALFRSSQISRDSPGYLSWLNLLCRGVYQIVVEWVLSIELPWDTQVGASLKLHHGVALVIFHETIIGNNCTLRHSTTIGNKKLPDGSYSTSPKIGNNVDIGSNVVILGPITVGDGAVIGAGAVVVKDVPENAVVVGNPAKVIRVLGNNPSLVNGEELGTLRSNQESASLMACDS